MMKRLLLLPALLLMFTAAGRAADLWKAKQVKEWSREETQHFLRSSPWVRQVTTGSLIDSEAPIGSTETTEGRRESSGAEQAPSTETVDVERGEGRLVYFVEWSSAQIVRQANLHYRVLLGQAKGEEKEPPVVQTYVLTVHGVSLRAFATVTDAEVKGGASLRLKQSHAQIGAVDARIAKAKDGRVVAVQFAFPREVNGQPTISDQEKSVEFVCKAGDLTLKADFNLAKMTTGQGRDL
ncbi:MAG: hypothetical protein LAO07_21255 [Acidobacteriia bacterium]|nr:hypothetical protein [Terriglobia bacterium]